MNRRMNLTLLALLPAFAIGLAVPAKASPHGLKARSTRALFSFFVVETDRDRDGLAGPVRRVKTETAKLQNKGGKVVEGQRAVLESVAYDIKGGKIESAYFPLPGGNLTGKEVYKYDDKGNIVEMTLLDAQGTLLSKEVYTYEFDAFGNWTKMTTSVAVIEGGKVSYEPTEVTYRTISYYLDEATLAKMRQPSPAPAQPVASPGASPSSSNSAGARTSVPLPSGASLVKASAAAPGSMLNLPTGSSSTGPVLKVDGEPPPPPAPAQVAATPAPKPLLKPMSGGVLNGKAMTLPKPVYPPSAKNSNASGTVTVDVVIDESGKVISAKAVDGHPMLRLAAQQAAQGARFSPTLLSGQPVKIAGQITYTFTLK